MFQNNTSAGLSSGPDPLCVSTVHKPSIENSDVSKCPIHVALFVVGTTRRPRRLLTHSHTSHLHGTYTHRTLASTPASVGICRGIFLSAFTRALTVASIVASTSAGRRRLHLSRSFAICGASPRTHGETPSRERSWTSSRSRSRGCDRVDVALARVRRRVGGRATRGDGRTKRTARIGLLS